MSWYAVRTATRREYWAEAALIEAGITVYVPSETRMWKHARKEELRPYPLFPGYIFAEFGPEDVEVVNGCEGVSKIIGSPTEANLRGSPIPERGLAWMGALEYLGAFNRDKTIDPTYSEGRRIRIKGGKLTGALGEILKAKGQNRFFVMLEVFGRLKRFDVAKADLELAA